MPELDARDELLARVADAGGGLIVRRQTTNWDIEVASDPGPVRYRIHFRRKREASFSASTFRTLAITSSHPVLAQYREAWFRVFVGGAAPQSEELVSALDCEVRALSDGWRSLATYANATGNIAGILSCGYGLVMEGPETIAAAVTRLLNEAGARATVLPTSNDVADVEALLLGSSFVVADGFCVETARAS